MNSNKAYIPNPYENKRLLLQNHLLDSFDRDVYTGVFASAGAPLTILDVGCNSGDMLIPRLEGFVVKSYIGIDKSEPQIEKARQHYGSGSFCFLTMDIESEAFADDLADIMSSHGIGSFGVINISMVLLHLKDPQRLLDTLHRFLAEDGTIIIRDIDDGLNLAYPDDRGLFPRIYKIAEVDDITGNRFTGRKVFGFLQKAGYREILLRRTGLSTSRLNAEQKREFYDMTYKTILDRTEVMRNKYPGDELYEDNYRWVLENSAAVRELFLREDFSALIGFMTYTAKHK